MILGATILCLATAASVSADEVTYRDHVQPLFDAKCAACHGASSPYIGDFDEDPDRYAAMNLGPRMDSYADMITFVVYPDTGALVRRLDDGRVHPEGKAGNMYQDLGEDEEERQRNLAIFKAWVGGGEAWNPARWREMSKEQLDRIEVAY